MDLSILKSLTKKLETLKKELQKEGKEAFSLATADLFLNHPPLKSFGWKQYTPYFNDGDPCVFRVCSDPDINGVDGYDLYEDEQVPGYTDYESMDSVRDDIDQLINALPDEIMETIFGEGRVTIHRDGTIETEEYDHD